VTDSQHFSNKGDYQRLLDSMFERENEELLAKLREQVAEEEQLENLSRVSGIEDQEVIRGMADLGIHAESLAAITLYPLVCVAYADGVLNKEERELIMKVAHEWNMDPGSPGFEVLEHWLSQGPSEDGFHVWQDYVKAISARMTPQQKEKLRESVVSRCTAVAEAVGDVLGRFGIRKSKQEREKLAEIEATFAAAS